LKRKGLQIGHLQVLWNKRDAKSRKEQRREQEKGILGLKDVTPTTPPATMQNLENEGVAGRATC
jgi:hypothetical protein